MKIYKANKFLIGNAPTVCFPWSRREPMDPIFIGANSWVLRNIKWDIISIININDKHYRCYIANRLIGSTKSLESAKKLIEESLDITFVKDNLKNFT